MCITGQSTSWIPIYTAVIALVGVLLGSYLTARYSFQNQLGISTYQARQQSYSAIMGKKVLLSQLLVSRHEALIHSDYHELLWKLAGAPAASLDFEEAKRWMHKSEDLALEIAKQKQSLYESLGMARASFPATDELNALAERIYHFQAITIQGATPGSDQVAIQAWKNKAVGDLQKFVQEIYSDQIDSLLEHLRRHINDPVSY